MSDISSVLPQYNVNLQQGALDAFGARVADFNNQQTLGQSVANAGAASAFGQYQQAVTAPITTTANQLDQNGVWDSIRYASDLINYAPKSRFLFKVKFTFNSPYSNAIDREFMYVVKEIDKPKVTFEYEDVNMYNFKTRVLKAIKYEPLTMSFHDDIQNKVSDFFNEYRKAYSPVSNITADQFKTIESGGMSFTTPGSTGGLYSASMGILAGNNVHILNHIDVVQVYAHGTRQTTFTFTNPRIETFDFDNLTHESSEGNGLTCTFSYDALYMTDSVVTGTPEYSWGKTDLIGSSESGTPQQFGNVLMGDGSSTGKPYTFNLGSLSAFGDQLSDLSSGFPQLTSDVVSSIDVGSFDSGTSVSSALPSIDQATAGLSNTYGFSIAPDSGTQAQTDAMDTSPASLPDVFGF